MTEERAQYRTQEEKERELQEELAAIGGVKQAMKDFAAEQEEIPFYHRAAVRPATFARMATLALNLASITLETQSGQHIRSIANELKRLFEEHSNGRHSDQS